MKVRRIYREDYEASITPELIHKLIIVAAKRGFHQAQISIRMRREMQEEKEVPLIVTGAALDALAEGRLYSKDEPA